MARYRKLSTFNIVTSLLVILVIAVNLLTVTWGVLASFKSGRELVVYPPQLFAFEPTLENYRSVIEGGFLRAVANSALYGLAAAVMVILCGSMAAFGMGRFKFRGQHALFLTFVAGIPLAMGAAAMLIPNYLMFASLGITNTWFTLPLIYSAHMLPLAVWVIRGSMDSVPYELDEAAYVDGASSFTVLWRVILPLCKPALAAVAILVFIHAWNEFVAGSAMIDANELKPIQPVLYQFIGFFGRDWGPLTAASTIAMIPVFMLYAFFGRYLVSGLTHGATKG